MDDKVESFLQKIAQIESSGGKYTDHPEIKSGIHKGQSAIGTYALMPNTVDEIVTRSGNKELSPLLEMAPEEKKAYIESNPKVEQMLAQSLAQHVLERQSGDEEKAAYSWLYGHNLTPNKIEKRNYQDEPYVEKYRNLMENKGSYPLSIEGTPEGDKVKDYIEKYSLKDDMRKHFQKQQDDLRRAMEIASRGPFTGKTSEDEAFEQQTLDPITRGLLSGGPGSGISANIIKNATPTIKSGARSAFDKIRNLLRKPMTPEEFIAKEASNPKVQEVLRDVRHYEPPSLPDPNMIAQIDSAVERMALERELDTLKQTAKHADEITEKIIPAVKKRKK